MTIGSVAAFKLFVAVVLYLFLPLSALTYYLSTRQRRVIEVDRVLAILVRRTLVRQSLPSRHAAGLTVGAVGYASVVSWIGLTLFFFSEEIGLPNGELPAVESRLGRIPAAGIRASCWRWRSWARTFRASNMSIGGTRRATSRRRFISASVCVSSSLLPLPWSSTMRLRHCPEEPGPGAGSRRISGPRSPF